jgi:hypothetical protein
MSNRTPDARAASRAEARRRARLAARGELPETDDPMDEPAPAPSRSGGGFFSRIFPPAPPLPGRGDPLAGFDRDGPLRPVRERLFLLRSNLVAWLATGVVAFIGFYASFAYQRNILGIVGTFVLFGALIAAGWFGWQRPTLYGTAAALVSFVLGAALLILAFNAVDPSLTTGDIVAALVPQALYQPVLGCIGGWYGGYLRRRQTQIGAETRGTRTTRRR